MSTWPPPTASRWYPRGSRPSGWTLWPKLGNIRNDDQVLHDQFCRAIEESYAQSARRGRLRQNRIIFADEVVGLTRELGLGAELDALWMRGSSMGLGLWAATQRPFHAPLHAYNAPVHLFLHRDPDTRNVQRYREIGGVDPRIVANVTRQLDLHEFLYIRRRDYTMCVVSA